MEEPRPPADGQTRVAEERERKEHRGLLLARRHEEDREHARLPGAPQLGVVGEEPDVRVEVAEPWNTTQEVDDEHSGETHPQEAQASSVDCQVSVRETAKNGSQVQAPTALESLDGLSDFGGIRIEDDVVVTSAGAEVLGPFSTDISS